MPHRSQKKHHQQRMPLRSLPLQKRTLKKASITNPKCSPVSATTTAMGTRWVMPKNIGTAQGVLFSNDPAHVLSAFNVSDTNSRYASRLARRRLVNDVRCVIA